MVRHCSVCRSTAHDRRNCPKLERNPEFYGYPPHPIRHGKGVHRDNGEPYDPRKAKGDEKAAKHARQVAKGSPATRKAMRPKEKPRRVYIEIHPDRDNIEKGRGVVYVRDSTSNKIVNQADYGGNITQSLAVNTVRRESKSDGYQIETFTRRVDERREKERRDREWRALFR